MVGSNGDPHGDELVKEMDAAGISNTVVLPIDYGMALGEPDISIEDLNHKYRDIAKKHSGRLIWFAGIDPRRESPVDLTKCPSTFPS